MRSDTKVIYGSIIILTTIVVIGSFFAVIQFQYAQNQAQTNTTTTPSATTTNTTSELVVVHLNVPVTVDRFGVTLMLTTQQKINDSAISTDLTLTTPTKAAPTTLHFTGIGESQTTTDGYTIRVINATATTAQILVGR